MTPLDDARRQLPGLCWERCRLETLNDTLESGQYGPVRVIVVQCAEHGVRATSLPVRR